MEGWKGKYIHGHKDQLIYLITYPGERNIPVTDPAHQAIATRVCQAILERFDPETMACETSASLLRHQLIDQTMTRDDQTWFHFPAYDYRWGASDQHLW